MVKSLLLFITSISLVPGPLPSESVREHYRKPGQDDIPLSLQRMRTSTKKKTRLKQSPNLCYNDGFLSYSNTHNLVETVLRVSERRDIAGNMYIPEVPPNEILNGDDDEDEDNSTIINEEMEVNGMIVYETFEWFLNVLPTTTAADDEKANQEMMMDGTNSAQTTMSNYFLNLQTEVATNWGYRKWAAFDPWWLLFIGIHPDTAKSTDIRNTLFGTNLEDRGNQNLMKQQYMTALTCDKLPLYERKVQQYIDHFILDITVNQQPVLSRWSTRSQELFLDLHLGNGHDHPQFMIDFMKLFIDLQAPGSTGYVQSKADDLQIASCLSNHVREYVETRRQFIIQNNVEDTFLFHWDKAGLPKEALLAEIVHNFLAWGQYVNILFKIIRAQLQGYEGIENVGTGPIQMPPINLFDKMKEAGTNIGERLNVARETFRLLLPVGDWFSQFQNRKDLDDSIEMTNDNFNVQTSKHIPLFIQAINDNFDPESLDTDEAEYETSRYTNFEVSSCPFLSAQDSSNPTDLFTVSSLDGETVIPKSHPEFFPVFESGSTIDGTINGMKYCPFGLGYRRCPSELFNLFVVEKLLISLADINFRVEPPTADLFDPIVYGDIDFEQAIPMGKDRARDNIFVIPGGSDETTMPP